VEFERSELEVLQVAEREPDTLQLTERDEPPLSAAPREEEPLRVQLELDPLAARHNERREDEQLEDGEEEERTAERLEGRAFVEREQKQR